MKNRFIYLFIVLISMTAFAEAEKHFGTGAKMDKLVKISALLNEPENYLDKEVTVTGSIVAVCEKRGCWLKLASDQKFQTLRIKVKDGDMVFPFNSKGKTAYATGKLTAKTLPKEQAIAYLQHMAKEAKESFDPSSVTQEMTIYQLVPTGVTIVN